MSKCLHCGHEPEGTPRFCPECGTKLGESAGASDSLLGRTLSQKYRIVEELGSGGMGTVYMAEHTGLKKRVAVKVLHADLQVSEESMQRFQREGIAAGSFSHPGAIQIFDFDKDESGVLYLAMELVEGYDLKTFLRREGILEPAQAVALTRQILEVLAEAHQHGIVHRDLKPDNIMITSERGTGSERHFVKLLDFGLSKLVDRPLDASLMTQTGRIMGTPSYMSPEQCKGGEVDHRSDLYSVGLVLYEMLSGEPTFSGDSVPELLVKHASEPPPSLLDVHPELGVSPELDEVLQQRTDQGPGRALRICERHARRSRGNRADGSTGRAPQAQEAYRACGYRWCAALRLAAGGRAAGRDRREPLVATRFSLEALGQRRFE